MADTAHREAEQSRARTDALIAQATGPTPRQNAESQPLQQAASTKPAPTSASPAAAQASASTNAASSSSRVGYFACKQPDPELKKQYWSSIFTAPWTFDVHTLDRYAAEFTRYLVSQGYAVGQQGNCWMESSEQNLRSSNESAKHGWEVNQHVTNVDIDWRPSSP
jgi:hypothetical protein